jgi:NAD-dependent deacetylase
MLDQLAARMSASKRITVLTGAGVSAASGVPTFRGPQGLWRNFRPESLATPDAFHRDPKLVWEWYNWRREILSTKKPNRAHEVLAKWSRHFPDFRLITQTWMDFMNGPERRMSFAFMDRFGKCCA